MQYPRTHGISEYDFREEGEYSAAYSQDDKGVKTLGYASYPPKQATRSSKFRDNDFSLSDRTLVRTYDRPFEDQDSISEYSIERRDSALPAKSSRETRENRRHRPTTHSREITTADPASWEANPANVRRSMKNTKSKQTVFIETLTVPSNGPPLETHFRNTKGNVHIKHLKIEDSTVSSPRSAPQQRRTRTTQRPAEEEAGGVSKLTRICELATVAALVLQWKEYKSNK